MLLNYKKCIELYGSDYQINIQIRNGQLYKVEKGLYSTTEKFSEVEVISCKYPLAVFSMDSAFYYHSLTDVIPDLYYLATERNATRIQNLKVKQLFIQNNLFQIGKTVMNYQGTEIQIYCLERMLIELIRNKNTIPFDYYKEIIGNYRKRVEGMDFSKVYEYCDYFSLGEKFMEAIQMEVL